MTQDKPMFTEPLTVKNVMAAAGAHHGATGELPNRLLCNADDMEALAVQIGEEMGQPVTLPVDVHGKQWLGMTIDATAPRGQWLVERVA